MLVSVLIRAVIVYLILLAGPGAVSFRRNVLATRATSSLAFTIRPASDIELPVVAKFLSETMYGATVPNGQRNELSRLELIELRDRFGNHVGRSRYPSTLLIAEDDQAIIGCVGLDCQVLDSGARKLSKHTTAIKYNTAYNSYSSSTSSSSSISTNNRTQNTSRTTAAGAMQDTVANSASNNVGKGSSTGDNNMAVTASNEHRNTVLVLTNLAVRADMRKQGVATQLLSMCDEYAKERGFEFLYLMVNAENAVAQQLYRKNGYKEVFRDKSATCVLPGNVGLSTAQCVNLCYRKSVLDPAKSRLGIVDRIGGMFRNVFK